MNLMSLILAILVLQQGNPAGQSSEWFYDSEAVNLPKREFLVQPLSSRARSSQDSPRLVDGFLVTGLPEDPGRFDKDMVELLKQNGIPGASLAIAYRGNLVLARGYGRTSTVHGKPVEPTTPGNILSISKPLTVMAALKFVERGEFTLDKPVADVLKIHPLLKPGEVDDGRLSKITVRMLMNHTSGMDNAVEPLFDPAFFRSLSETGKINLVNGRPSELDISRRSLALPLVAEPGTAFNYSGQAMQLLGRIVEFHSHERLDKFIRESICGPLGIRSYFVSTYLNQSDYQAYFRADRANFYFFCPSPYDATSGSCISRDTTAPVRPWGEADACGTAFMNVIDLCRLVTSVPSMFKPEMVRQISARAKVLPSRGNAAGSSEPKVNPFGLGWGILDEPDGGIDLWHFGSGSGCRAYASLLANGLSFALIIDGDGKNAAGIDQIIRLPQLFLQQYADRSQRFPSWSDYGFGW